MLDARRLLDSLLQAGMTDSTGRRIRTALGQDGPGTEPASGQGGGLLGQLAGMLGTTGQGGRAGGGLGGVLGQVLGGLQQSAGRAGESLRSNDPITVGGLGAIVGAVLGGRGGAVGGGALALLGSLAVAALQAAKAQQEGQSASQSSAAPADAAALERLASEDTALLLVRAMIEAAKADGRVDPAEIERIAGKLEEIGADAETRAWVTAELRAPADPAGLVARVRGPELAAEVYAASLLAIEVDTPAERAYLDELARRLALPAPVVAHIHRALGVA